MSFHIPSSQEVRDLLQPLTLKQIERLAELSGVPSTTIYKIKRGETDNPGIETVWKFFPYVQAVTGRAIGSIELHSANSAPHSQTAQSTEPVSVLGEVGHG